MQTWGSLEEKKHGVGKKTNFKIRRQLHDKETVFGNTTETNSGGSSFPYRRAKSLHDLRVGKGRR
jgi:hypothetical protein